MRPRIYLSPPHMGADERSLLLEAFDSNWIAPLGPHVDAFEREFCAITETRHAAALSSGTAALHLALLILGVKANDLVLVSDLTFAATVNAIRYVGAQPVLIDADPETWTLSPGLVREALEQLAAKGQLPAALVTVDLYGQCADYDALRAACAEYGVPILQDAAEALGATYRGLPAGSQGDLAAFSFNGNKILTTSGGGMLVSSRADWVERARHLSTQARVPAAHYEHEEVGYNYRLSNLLAAVGRGQLRSLPSRVERRREHFAAYQQGLGDLPGWQLMPEAAYGRSNRWLTCVTLDGTSGPDREQVRLALEEANIEARPVWKPMHLQPAFKGCLTFGGSCSEQLFRDGLCLPSGSSLTDQDRDLVITTIRQRATKA
jgi:dTDP-4-amino-4,6-dideoxygalactose transaminase